MIHFLIAIFPQILLLRLLPASKLMAAFILILAENRLRKGRLGVSRFKVTLSWFHRGLFISFISKFPRIGKYLTIVSLDTVLKDGKVDCQGSELAWHCIYDLLVDQEFRNPPET